MTNPHVCGFSYQQLVSARPVNHIPAVTASRSSLGRNITYTEKPAKDFRIFSAFLGPVVMNLPYFLNQTSKNVLIQLRNRVELNQLLRTPRNRDVSTAVTVSVVDAQTYGISANAVYNPQDLEKLPSKLLNVEDNRRCFRFSLLLRIALARKGGGSSSETSQLEKTLEDEKMQDFVLLEALMKKPRAYLLRTLQKFLALLAPVDVLFGLAEFLKFSAASFDLVGLGRPKMVAVCNVPDLDNAFFVNKYMVFGNGRTQFFPLVSVDVLGHEMSHGIVEEISPLTYQGHSGALNESFADIIGTCFEFYLFEKYNQNKNKEDDLSIMGKPDFEIGEDLDMNGRYLRNMAYPEHAPQPQPSSVGGQHYIDPASSFDYGGVHINSGIYNVCFFRLVKKIGMKEALGVFFDTLRSGVPPECSFEEFASHLLHNVRDNHQTQYYIRNILSGCNIQPAQRADRSENLISGLQHIRKPVPGAYQQDNLERILDEALKTHDF